MYHIKAKHVNEAFIVSARMLLDQGEYVSPRGQHTIELKNAFIDVSQPQDMICLLPERDIDRDYLQAELDWYENGDLNAAQITEYSSFWKKLVDENGKVNSNYGYIAQKQNPNQLEWCINSLKDDNQSRQAVINYNQPIHKYEGNKDFVCTLSQQFLIRNDRLDTIIHMRSNDLIYGFSYDAPWFTYLQTKICEEVGVAQGSYFHYATSLHVYEKHFEMLERIANADL